MTSHRRGWRPERAGSDGIAAGPPAEDTDDDVRRRRAAAVAAEDCWCCFVPQAQIGIDAVAEDGADAASGPAAAVVVVVDRCC